MAINLHMTHAFYANGLGRTAFDTFTSAHSRHWFKMAPRGTPRTTEEL